MPAKTIGRLRVIAFVEGCSFLLLLGVAMPLKYFANLPLAVTIVGSIHGGLFILFCVALSQAMSAARWSMVRAGDRLPAQLVALC
jgi:integral membrane protein